jgi:hypothetical protein
MPVGAAAAEGSSLDVEDNVDVAAATTLNDPATVAAATAAAAAAAPTATDGSGSAASAARKKRPGVFDSHRMATYRRRLLAICQGAGIVIVHCWWSCHHSLLCGLR